jgi:hypothetical protein
LPEQVSAEVPVQVGFGVSVRESVYMEKTIKLGCFSISLAVKDLNKSKEFYENLGFEVFAGEPSHNFLIIRSIKSLPVIAENRFSDYA